MLRVLSAEWLKIRRKGIWFLVMLGPLGAVGLQGLNYAIRYDYLMPLYADDPWGRLITNVTMLMLPSMFIGLAILASMNAGIEHQMNAWKQTLALPVKRRDVFLAKFFITSLLLLVSSTLIIAFTLMLGWLLGLEMNPPVVQLLQASYYPYLAIMPFVALQTNLSVLIHNQAVPLTVGILGTVISMFALWLPDWMPWIWPYLENSYGEPLYSVLAGVGTGAVILLIGMLVFNRKDVR
ncbi:ABC transporter permease [Paenibacillus daejeonensis]|uniref:ABC transporter permease n=1 Tax=Paenibacillus daejeonensis TaxID=135193 RepID=UPI00035E2A9C|nr:ABC transporter permease [Paenibacillus daejeonensis]